MFDNFLSNRKSGNNGEFFTWDEASNRCTKSIYIVDGYIYESEDEFDSMNANLSCLEWLSNKENNKYTGRQNLAVVVQILIFSIMGLIWVHGKYGL